MEITSAQFTSMVADIASMKASMEAQKENIDRILKILEGNGKPGLIEHSIDSAKERQEIKEKIMNLEADVKEVKKLGEEGKGELENLAAEFRSHTADGNPQHETIIAAFRAKPLQYTMLAIALFLFMVLGVTTGFFEHVLMFFKKLIP